MNKLITAIAGLMTLALLYGCVATTGGNKTTENNTAKTSNKAAPVNKAPLTAAISISESIAYARDSGATTRVMNECIIDRQLPDFIESYAGNIDIAVVQKNGRVSSKNKGKVLVMEFSDIIGTGGGAWSGSKSVTVKGELFENKKMIGSFKARRVSGGGFWGAYKGTCSILERCVNTLGKDISIWLSSPTMNARLGNM